MTIFDQVKPVPGDPILGLLEVFRADPRPEKVNLTVGVYQDETGRTPILETVRLAEHRLLQTQTTKDYIGISGDPTFARLVPDLLWPSEYRDRRPSAIATFQTLGGSGALRVAADFFRSEAPNATVWMSQPTWPNHPGIFKASGLSVASYRYFDPKTSSVDLAGMLEDLTKTKAGDVVILHGCCHNPTGADLTIEQWEVVGQRIQDRTLFPVVDLAYQGFAKGLVEDAAGVLRMAELNDEMFVCVSFSKTFGLYRERIGALVAVGRDTKSMEAVASRLRICVRTNYSNPPAHGGAIVGTILSDEKLRGAWELELVQMRNRIAQMRSELVRALHHAQCSRDFSFLGKQYGMFAMSGLTPEQVTRLRDEHAIYILDNGRINVAGLNPSNLPRVVESIANVLK